MDGQPPAEPAITGGVVLSGLIEIRPAENNSKTATIILTGSDSHYPATGQPLVFGYE